MKSPHQFIEHLLARTMGKEQDYSGISIKPAITPDVLPDAYHLPEKQQFIIPFPLILDSSASSSSSIISSNSQQASAASPGSSHSQESSKLPKHTPVVSKKKKKNIIPQKDSKIDDTSSSSTLSFQADISSLETNVEKHNAKNTKVSKDKNKDKETDAQIISKEINKLDQKRQIIYPEKVYKQQHVPSQLEYVEGTPASNVENQEGKQIKQNETGSLLLSPVSPRIYNAVQATRQQNLETSQRYPEEPSVTINIGHIDVRATIPQKPSTKTQQFSPTLSLKDYLKQRSEVSR